MGTDLTAINAARISFGGESRTLEEKDVKLLDYLAKNDHLSPFEHVTATFMIECPLYIRSQIHRHRTFAYNEISRRYTADDLEFYLPPLDDIRVQAKSNKQGSDGTIDEEEATEAYRCMRQVVLTANGAFNRLIEMGVAREQARGILPQCLMTKFFMSGNLRNWIHFIRLRDHAHAQKEAAYVARAVKAELLARFPETTKALLLHAKG